MIVWTRLRQLRKDQDMKRDNNEIGHCLHEDEERLCGWSWILNHNVPGWLKGDFLVNKFKSSSGSCSCSMLILILTNANLESAC